MCWSHNSLLRALFETRACTTTAQNMIKYGIFLSLHFCLCNGIYESEKSRILAYCTQWLCMHMFQIMQVQHTSGPNIKQKSYNINRREKNIKYYKMSKPERICHMSSRDRTFWSKSEKWNVCLLENLFMVFFL